MLGPRSETLRQEPSLVKGRPTQEAAPERPAGTAQKTTRLSLPHVAVQLGPWVDLHAKTVRV